MTPRVESFITALAMACIAAAFFWFGTEGHAQDGLLAARQVALHDVADKTKQLANAVAPSISVPRQLKHDHDIDPVRGGKRWLLSIRTVAPTGLGEDWNLVSRTLLPVPSQDEEISGASGPISAVGPVLLGPTAWSYTLSTASTHDWEDGLWAAPVNEVAAQVARFGDPLVSLHGGMRDGVDAREGDPQGPGLRVTLTLLVLR